MKQSFFSLKVQVRNKKNFVYKNKKYPIDFDLLKRNSNFFYRHKRDYKYKESIEIEDEYYQYSDKMIREFTSCCQNERFEVNKDIIFPLYRLSVIYEVQELNKILDDYISKNQKSLAIKAIIFKLQVLNEQKLDEDELILKECDCGPQEDLIASSLFDYIDNDEILRLPLINIYKIINNKNFKYKKLKFPNKKKLLDFFYKCLNNYGKEASVLFSKLDYDFLEEASIEMFQKLTDFYSDVFDFNMLSSQLLMKIVLKLKMQISDNSKIKDENAILVSENSKIKDENSMLVSENSKIKNENSMLVSENSKIKDEILKIRNENTKLKNDLSKRNKFDLIVLRNEFLSEKKNNATNVDIDQQNFLIKEQNDKINSQKRLIKRLKKLQQKEKNSLNNQLMHEYKKINQRKKCLKIPKKFLKRSFKKEVFEQEFDDINNFIYNRNNDFEEEFENEKEFEEDDDLKNEYDPQNDDDVENDINTNAQIKSEEIKNVTRNFEIQISSENESPPKIHQSDDESKNEDENNPSQMQIVNNDNYDEDEENTIPNINDNENDIINKINDEENENPNSDSEPPPVKKDIIQRRNPKRKLNQKVKKESKRPNKRVQNKKKTGNENDDTIKIMNSSEMLMINSSKEDDNDSQKFQINNNNNEEQKYISNGYNDQSDKLKSKIKQPNQDDDSDDDKKNEEDDNETQKESQYNAKTKKHNKNPANKNGRRRKKHSKTNKH